MSEVSKVDVVGVGLNATDTLIPLQEFPARGSKVEFESASILPGGEVASAMVACQFWGLRTRYVGKFGDDYAAQIHSVAFERAGVETHLFTAPGCPKLPILYSDRRDRRNAPFSAVTMNASPFNLPSCNANGSLRAGPARGRSRYRSRVPRRELGAGSKAPVVADLDKLYPTIDSLLPGIDYLELPAMTFPAASRANLTSQNLCSSSRKNFANKTFRRHARPRRRPRVRRFPILLFACLQRARCGHDWRRRHFSRRLHLRAPPELAYAAPTRICLRRRRTKFAPPSAPVAVSVPSTKSKTSSPLAPAILRFTISQRQKS